jgi:large subunit ribosomal protein L23
MALLDFLKNKESAKKSKASAKKTGEVKVAKKTEKKAEKKETTPKAVVSNVGAKGFSYDVIKEPHISEKGTYLAEVNQYVFEVAPSSNKQEIRKAVSGIYGVDVVSVNIIQIPAKKRRLGKTQGFRKAYKKAIVKIKEGQKIEIL